MSAAATGMPPKKKVVMMAQQCKKKLKVKPTNMYGEAWEAERNRCKIMRVDHKDIEVHQAMVETTSANPGEVLDTTLATEEHKVAPPLVF
jgi:hypothetical protein